MHDIALIEGNRSANQLTHALKLFGNGNMNTGLERLGALHYDMGKERGYLIGVRDTLGVVVLIYLIKKTIDEREEQTDLKNAKSVSKDMGRNRKLDAHKVNPHKNIEAPVS